jgi:hypothetical protein
MSAWIAGLSFISANLGSLELMGWAGSAYQYGILAMHWYWIGAIPPMLFLGIVMMPFYYISRTHSVPRYLKLRFGEGARGLSAACFALMTILMSGVNMYAMAVVVQTVLGWNMTFSIWVGAITVAIYVMLGGLRSAIINEVLQFILIWAGAALIPILGLIEAGGWTKLKAQIAVNVGSSDYTHLWSTLGSFKSNPMGIHWTGIVFGLGGIISFDYWTTDFLVVQRVLSANNLRSAKLAPVIGGGLQDGGPTHCEGGAIVIPRTQLRTATGTSAEGLKAEYFDNDNFTGTPAATRIDKQIDFDWNGASPVPGKISGRAFSVRWAGTLQAPAAGDYEITGILSHCNPCSESEHYTVKYDGKELAASAVSTDKSQHGAMTTAAKLHIDDTNPHPIEITYSHTKKLLGAGFSLQWVPLVEPMRAQALDAIHKADITLAFVGLSPNLEGEEMPVHIPGFSGGDRTDIALPAAQQKLLEAAKATGKPLVVILMNGSALAVNWAQQNAGAILEAWYPGQAGAQAIAETLVGENNPAGRLPITFYTGVDQLPEFEDYSMANRTYRYFKGQSLYGFGYGLSYTTFAYSHLKLSATNLHAGDTLVVEADVKNTGNRAGDEVAELYLTPPHTNVSPALALDGFTRIHLAPGDTKHITFTLAPRTLSQVDEKGVRAVTPGTYRIAVGGSQPNVGTDGQTANFTIEGTQELPH